MCYATSGITWLVDPQRGGFQRKMAHEGPYLAVLYTQTTKNASLFGNLRMV